MNQKQLDLFFEVAFHRRSLSEWKAQDTQSRFFFEKHQKQVIGSGTYGYGREREHSSAERCSSRSPRSTGSSMRSKKSKYFMRKKAQYWHFYSLKFPITALREIKFLKSLKHPNILNIKDITTRRKVKDGIRRIKTYCVLDFMDLDVLSVVQANFKEKRSMPLEIIQAVLYQVLQFNDQSKCLLGLQYLHQKRVIHRDIKNELGLFHQGANVLISQTGEVKIADFGLAKYVPANSIMRKTPTVVTLSYRAPEVLFTKGLYDFKIDLWSVGCFAFELAFNYPLFNARNEQEHVKMMVDICGTPTEESWPGITRNELFQIICPQKQSVRRLLAYIKDKNQDINPSLLELIDLLLIMNPQQRITIEEALNHRFFYTYDNYSGIQNMKAYAENFVPKMKDTQPQLQQLPSVQMEEEKDSEISQGVILI